MHAADHVLFPTSATPLLAAAVFYVSLGFAVTPVYGVNDAGACMCNNRECSAPGKHPVGSQWQKRAARTQDDARDLFDGHVGNIGLYLGGTDRVLLDFDGAAGLRIRDELLADGLLPRTLTARSGSGMGEHRVYQFASRHDASAVTDRRVGVGWDVKKMGQFLVAPSRHASGGCYEWTDESPIAELPDALYERIRRVVGAPPASRRPRAGGGRSMLVRARAYVATMDPAISGAGGHDATFNVARKVVQDFGLDDGEAWDVLCEYNQRCQPPWSERELRHKLDSAKAAHTRNPIEDRPRPSDHAPSGAHEAASAESEHPPRAPDPSPDDGGPDWNGALLWTTSSRTNKRKLVKHHENVIRILQLHPAWAGRIRYDEFRGRTVVREPPWSDFTRPHEAEPTWTDEDATRLAGWLRTEFHRYDFDPSVTDCERSVDVVARTHGFHPIRDYLAGLEWDKVPRLRTMGATYFGTEPTDYAANVFRWWMISAVARVLRPGCKADHVLILEGRQGKGKSTALEILAGAEWFSDSAIDLNSKDAFERVRGRWIVELAELDALFRVESSRAKQFFSSKRDDYRPAYARREREQLRQCVFAGSVNEGVYLKDPTGARRFWPVRCLHLDLQALRRDRDQLWAEALFWYRDGARWWPDAHDLPELEQEQAERTERDEWTTAIQDYLNRIDARIVTTAELMKHALLLEPRDWSRQTQMRVGSILLNGLGWMKRRERIGDDLRWVYERVIRP